MCKNKEGPDDIEEMSVEESRFVLPDQDVHQPAGADRTSDVFKGTHAQGSSSLKSTHHKGKAERPYVAEGEHNQDKDAATVAPVIEDNHSDNSTIQTTHTKAPKSVSFDIPDNMSVGARDQDSDARTVAPRAEEIKDEAGGNNNESPQDDLSEMTLDTQATKKPVLLDPQPIAQGNDDNNSDSNSVGTHHPTINNQPRSESENEITDGAEG
jgi:hypothetical protein